MLATAAQQASKQSRNRTLERKRDSLIFRKLYVGVAVTLLVDAVLGGAARTVFLPVEVELEGRTAIFPSDALVVYFSFDPGGLGRFAGHVAPVRGREDAEGDGDAGVKVQVAGGKCEAASCPPFEGYRKETRINLLLLGRREEEKD